MNNWEIYTDGAVRNNGRPDAAGGIGVYIKRGPTALSLARPLIDGVTPTSNRAELWAIIAAIRIALNAVPPPNNVYIHTDSQYAIDSWLKAATLEERATAPPANWELLQRLKRLAEAAQLAKVKVALMKVKAHADSQGNQMADKLAQWAADHQKLTDADHVRDIPALLGGEATVRDQSREDPIIHEAARVRRRRPAATD